MIIKVCGMRESENIREVEALGIDLMGFIFWPKSSRYVSERPSYLPTKCKRVGVFVDANIDEILRIADEYALDIIQLHGHENPKHCILIRDQVSPEVKIIKAFNIATADDLAQTAAFSGLVDYFLFDTKGKSIGGNGEQFDWTVLSAYDDSTQFLLSGGIGPNDAGRLRALLVLNGFPVEKCIGIDLNSRFEVEPAYKDIKKLKTFLEQL